MEHWTFPPHFDANYLPPADSRYWFPRRETMPSGEREAAILERLQQLTRYAFDTSPFYRRKWDAAGFHPDHLRSLEDFEAKVPVVTKQDLREAQARVPPFGDYLCISPQDVHHIPRRWKTASRVSAPSGMGEAAALRFEMRPSLRLCWNSSVSRKFCPEAMTPLSSRIA